jgi:hypothetical protein
VESAKSGQGLLAAGAEGAGAAAGALDASDAGLLAAGSLLEPALPEPFVVDSPDFAAGLALP